MIGDMVFDPNIPIYLQIIDMIKLDIVNKKVGGGEKMKSVRELAEEIQVNPNTVQRAYQELERDGIVYTQRGTGKFVTTDEEKIKLLRNDMAKNILMTFVEGMGKLGFNNEEVIDITRSYISKRGEVK